MAWYYATGSEQRGPLTDEDFAALVNQGVVNASTLVWREGMANWQAYGEVAGVGAAAPETPGARATCAQCGRSVPADQVIELNNRLICAACKPLVVQRMREGLGVGDTTSEEIRKAHIKHEAAVKSIGVLYILGGSIMVLSSISMLVGAASAPSAPNRSFSLGAAAGGLVVSVLFIVVGIGIRRLRPWIRVPVGILSGFGLLGFPVGTLINAYILHLVFSQKGRTVLSESYRDVIAATPHVKYKTSIIVWIALGLLVVVLVLVVVGVLMSKH